MLAATLSAAIAPSFPAPLREALGTHTESYAATQAREMPAGPGASSLERHAGAIAATAGASPGLVAETLDLANGSLVPGNYLPPTCNGFWDIALAPSIQYAFVTCALSDTLMEFNLTTGLYAQSVQVGPSPEGIVFDPQNDRVYVAASNSLSGGGAVEIVDAKNMTIVDSIVEGCSPDAVTLDTALQRLYVANFCDGNITVISTANDSVIAQIPLGAGSEPESLVYNPYNQQVYVAEPGMNSVAVISATKDALNSTIDVSGQPNAIDCNPLTGRVYATLEVEDQLDMISGTTGVVLANVSLPSGPSALAVDPGTNRVYVAAGSLDVINATNLATVGLVSVGPSPQDVAVASGFGRAYVTDYLANDVTVIEESTLTVVDYLRSDPGPFGVSWNGVSQDVYVTNHASGTLARIGGQTDSLISASSLAFGLTGIAADIANGNLLVASAGNDRVYDTNASGAVLSSTVVGSSPDGMTYDGVNGFVYVANTAANTVSEINGSTGSLVQNVSIPPPGGIGGGPIDVAVEAGNGLLYVTVEGCFCSAPGNVTIIDTATNRVVGGIHAWGNPGPSALLVDTQNNELYVTDDYSNELWSFNLSTDALILTVPVGGSPEGLALDAQAGLLYVTNRDSNNVSVIATSTDRLVGSISVGLSPVGIAYDPSNGNIYVANEGSGTLSIITTPHPVVFRESGLPSGTNWNVTLGGSTASSVNSSIEFLELNGVYGYRIGGIPGWHVTSIPWSGSITVNVTSVDLAVNWSRTTYSVTFLETGLPANATWRVTLGGIPISSNMSAITFVEPNATYNFTVAIVPGYRASDGSGLVPVNGSNVTELVIFSMTRASGTGPTLWGWPAWEAYTTILLTLFLVGTGVVVGVWRLRRRRRRGERVERSKESR